MDKVETSLKEKVAAVGFEPTTFDAKMPENWEIVNRDVGHILNGYNFYCK